MKNSPCTHFQDWRKIARRAFVSGGIASVLSALALSLCGKCELNDPFMPINGPSQWILGRLAPYRRGFRFPHTPLGYFIHHAMSVFWAVLFEKWVHPGDRTVTFL